MATLSKHGGLVFSAEWITENPLDEYDLKRKEAGQSYVDQSRSCYGLCADGTVMQKYDLHYAGKGYPHGWSGGSWTIRWTKYAGRFLLADRINYNASADLKLQAGKRLVAAMSLGIWRKAKVVTDLYRIEPPLLDFLAEYEANRKVGATVPTQS
jgi:hypothetical protein